MKQEDLEFIAEIIERSHWLLYGDLDEYFDSFLKKVFAHELKDWGFGDVPMEPDFATAYWLLVSELCSLKLADYGTSPRGAWLTPDGQRFAKLVVDNNNAICQAEDYIYKKYNT